MRTHTMMMAATAALMLSACDLGEVCGYVDTGFEGDGDDTGESETAGDGDGDGDATGDGDGDGDGDGIAPHGTEYISLPTGGWLWIGHSGEPGPTTLVMVGQHGREVGPIMAAVGWLGREPWQGDLAVVHLANPWGAANGNNDLDPGLPLTDGLLLDLNWGWGPWTGGGGNYEISLATLDVIEDALGDIDYLYDIHSSPSRTLATSPGQIAYGHTVLAQEEPGRSDSYEDALELATKLQAVEPQWRAWSPEHPVGGDYPFFLDDATPTEVDWEYEGTLARAIWDAYPEAVVVTVEIPERMPATEPIFGQAPGEFIPPPSNGVRRRSRAEKMFGMDVVFSHIYDGRHSAP